jgi:hypothetical protein
MDPADPRRPSVDWPGIRRVRQWVASVLVVGRWFVLR